MYKKYLVAMLMIIFTVLKPLFSLEMTGEVLLNSIYTEKIPVGSEVCGNVFLSVLKDDNISSDVHFQIKKDASRINVAYIKFMRSRFDLTLGRQFMAWGSGYNFNPTDIFNSKPVGAAFDPSYLKGGRDALVLSSYFAKAVLDVVYAAEYSIDSRISSSESITEKGDESMGIVGFNFL